MESSEGRPPHYGRVSAPFVPAEASKDLNRNALFCLKILGPGHVFGCQKNFDSSIIDGLFSSLIGSGLIRMGRG